MSTPIEIVPYDRRWHEMFAAIRDLIAHILGSLAQRIEHVGSTAAPGLPAKPIIDIDVVINTRDDLPAVIKNLRLLGHHHEGNGNISGREAFTSPADTPSHHLYVCAVDTRNSHVTSPFGTSFAGTRRPRTPTPS
ncbi:GrpB family protein [Nonomuraea pusilla]|uniref:GrpB protein n=1 Tax=Nonomuraea pusilla TaxID=46177 RepID=A0A1H7IQS0_9ACTN|nr:GrpB family protein [Nonomuraea pusilla]SEK63125.1 GrpB protein [Nonomuraea pusilla]